MTKINLKSSLILLACCIYLVSCKDDDESAEPITEAHQVKAFFATQDQNTPQFTVIANTIDRIQEPQDLDFNPNRSNELWVINNGINQTGGSTVTITDAGLENQQSLWLRDGNAWHFMAFPSALSFSKTNENWATSADIIDANRQNGTFAGPSLWSSDMDIYAQDPGRDENGRPLNGSHLDMLHGSPYSLGIESDEENAFWVLDGYNEHIAWYDFKEDHGPGYHDHSDGIIYRYVDMPVSRNGIGIPQHIVEDDVTGTLFVVDTKNSRILWMNTLSAQINTALPLRNEVLASHQEMKNLEWGVFTDVNLDKPCGIEVFGDKLYVSDYETGEIIAYSLEGKNELARINTGAKGIMGIKMDPNERLWYVNALTNEVVRVDPR